MDGKDTRLTSSSSGAFDSLAAVLKTLGVNDTEMEPDVLGSGTGFSNNSFFLPTGGDCNVRIRNFSMVIQEIRLVYVTKKR